MIILLATSSSFPIKQLGIARFLGSNTYAIPSGQSFYRCHPWDHNPRVVIWIMDENGWAKWEIVKIRYLRDIDHWG